MDTIREQLELLLEAKPYEEMFEFCDFTLVEQNEVAAAKGIQTAMVNSSEYRPVIKKSVTYIVAAVLFNEHGEVLMMQVRNLPALISREMDDRIRFASNLTSERRRCV